MGEPKHLLRFSDGKLMYMRLLEVLGDACPDADGLYLSLRDRGCAGQLLLEEGSVDLLSEEEEEDVFLLPEENEKQKQKRQRRVWIIYDDTAKLSGPGQEGEGVVDIDPAAGLLAAYHTDPSAAWLVVACDLPLLISLAILQLREAFESKKDEEGQVATCFRNEKGFCEPLLAIWTPEALEKLEENVTKKGKFGPSL